MQAGSLRYWTQCVIHDARSRSAMGRAADAAGEEGGLFYPDISDPAALTDFMNFLINQVNALNIVVTELATQVDALRGA